MENGDPTWSMVNVSLWAMIEVSVGIMCSSIPGIKPLILRVAPRLLISAGDSNRGDTHNRDGTARRNQGDFGMQSIKVTHDIQYKVEEDIHDSDSMRNYGLQEPTVGQAFENYEKRPITAHHSDEALVARSDSRVSLKEKNSEKRLRT